MSISSTNANIKIFTFYGANNSRQLRKIISMLVVLSLIRKKNSGMRRIATNKQCLTTRVHAIYWILNKYPKCVLLLCENKWSVKKIIKALNTNDKLLLTVRMYISACVCTVRNPYTFLSQRPKSDLVETFLSQQPKSDLVETDQNLTLLKLTKIWPRWNFSLAVAKFWPDRHAPSNKVWSFSPGVIFPKKSIWNIYLKKKRK